MIDVKTEIQNSFFHLHEALEKKGQTRPQRAEWRSKLTFSILAAALADFPYNFSREASWVFSFLSFNVCRKQRKHSTTAFHTQKPQSSKPYTHIYTSRLAPSPLRYFLTLVSSSTSLSCIQIWIKVLNFAKTHK